MAHSRAVATTASELADVLLDDPTEPSVLVTAAWLHDIGYAPVVAKTGAHHLDGAIHLEELGEHRLACLVAHHGSGAAETALRGFADEFAQFPREISLVADILTYCDLSCGPDGTRLSLDERLREIRSRYGDDHVVVRGLEVDDDVIRRVSPSRTATRRSPAGRYDSGDYRIGARLAKVSDAQSNRRMDIHAR